MRFLFVGDTARIRYALADEFSNEVVGSTLAFTVGDPTLVSVDPSGLVKVLRNDGKATITVSSAGRQDTVGVRVLPEGSTECTEIAAPTAMSVGGISTVQGGNICLTGGAGTGAEYAVVAYNSSTNGAASSSATITALGAATPPSSLRAPAVDGPLLSRAPSGVAATATSLDESFHLRLLTEARGLKRLFRGARATRAARLATSPSARGGFTPSASYATIPATVNVGETYELNVSEWSCERPVLRGFRVAAVSAKSIVLADTLNPTDGFTDADYARFAARFDTLVYPLDVDNFDAPKDIDGNGRVLILFTEHVNELTPANSPSFVGGFFHPRDLFPKVATTGFEGCPTSNEGEMFYMLVPDPTGTVNGNRHTLGFVDTLTVGVIAHEFEHLINASRRMYQNTDAEEFEATWLDEGLAHVAEELLYYRESGKQPRQHLTDALIRPDAPTYAIWKSNAASNFARLLEYIEAPGLASPIDSVNDELATRGASWAFLRYAVDRAFPSDAGVWRRFTNSTVTGLNTVQGGLLTDPRPYLADFPLANYLSDLGITSDPRFIHQSWNYRNIFSNTFGTRSNGVFTPLGYYPIKLTGLAHGVSTSVMVRGGSASYYRLAVAAGREALVTFASGQGAPNPLYVFTVVRTK
jgi:hypothetical protein